MFNQYLTDTYQYLTNAHMSNSAKLILTDFLIEINIYNIWQLLSNI